ncbi:putative DEAD-box ATP-dependent RNA helicase 29 [Lycium ferocissimum]|uniref:putative DEAD-box ATP-dependent RNA helicase 29 n=1 Tax=Lycium ferocissimum TaxID=112874 RepID=UPI002815F302|nr:putative DEAD-box ATP-dependent RNA helicase 29 [Lycium ferocissimum]
MLNQWVDVMKMKRAIHEEVINKVRQQRSSVAAPKEDDIDPTPSKRKEKQGLSLFTLPFCGSVPLYLFQEYVLLDKSSVQT